MKFDLVQILTLLGAAQGLLFSLIIVSIKRFRKMANYFLAIFLMGFSLENLSFFLNSTGFTRENPEWLFVPGSWTLVFGPSFFFFALSILGRIKTWRTPYLLAFIPAMLQAGFYGWLMVQGGMEKIAIRESDWFSTYGQIEDAASMTYGGIFVGLGIFTMLRYNKKSTEEMKFTYAWLRNIFIMLFILHMIWIASDVFGKIGPLSLMHIVWAGVTLVIYWIGLSGYLHPELFTAVQVEQDNKEEDEKKYKRSSLTESSSASILTKANELMEKEKLYLNQDLSLPMLAEAIGVHGAHLSQAINENTEGNFNDYINQYRVEEFKERVMDPSNDHLTILAIAFESGFSSKSTFNTIFKKFTGHTPSAWKKQEVAARKEQV